MGMGRLGVRSGVYHNVSSNAVSVEQDTPTSAPPMMMPTREQQHYNTTIDEYYDTLTDFSVVLSENSGSGGYNGRTRDDSNTVEEILDPKTAAMRR